MLLLWAGVLEPHDPVHLNMCVRVCVESERELQYSLLMPSSCFPPSSSLPSFPPVSLSIPLPSYFSLTQAMTGSWEMMSADFHCPLSAALNLEGKDQYCKNKMKMEKSSKGGGFKENKTVRGKGKLKTQASKRAETKTIPLIIPSASCSGCIHRESAGRHFPQGLL